MKWEKVRLGDCCIKIGSGATPKGGSTVYVNEGTSFIRSQNVYNLTFDYDGLAHITDEAANKLRNVSVKSGDVLINITGDSVARTCIVPDNVLPARVNQHVAIIRPEPGILDYRYLNYYLVSPNMQAHMLGLSVGKGASRNAMTKEMIENYRIPCPPLDVQRRISEILLVYDDLIENNRKQIKLLEEAAQRLYRAWFVELRFPGHEHVRVVDGVPEGWKNTTLEDICTIRKETLTAKEIPEDTPYIGLEHMPRKDFCLSEWGVSSEVNSNKFRYYEDDILFGKIRPYFHKVGFALNNGVASTDSIVFVNKEGLWSILLMTLSSTAFVDYTYQSCKEGAKMPRADWNQMKVYPVLIGDADTQIAFEKQIFTITRKIKSLALQIRTLIEARDRLLPKLMNGEIEA